MPVPDLTPLQPLHQITSGMSTEAALRENDLALSDDKPLIALIAVYAQQDYGKCERLRQGCEAWVPHLTSQDASAIEHGVELGWSPIVTPVGSRHRESAKVEVAVCRQGGGRDRLAGDAAQDSGVMVHCAFRSP